MAVGTGADVDVGAGAGADVDVGAAEGVGAGDGDPNRHKRVRSGLVLQMEQVEPHSNCRVHAAHASHMQNEKLDDRMAGGCEGGMKTSARGKNNAPAAVRVVLETNVEKEGAMTASAF